MLKVKELREEFNRLSDEAKGVIDAAADDNNRELKPEEQTANETRFARMTVLKSLLDENERFASLKLPALEGDDDADDDEETGKIQRQTNPPGADFSKIKEGEIVVGTSRINRAEFNSAMKSWATNGGSMERKFATITTASQSGIFLPKEVAVPVVPTAVNTFREALAVYGVKPVETDNAGDLAVPVLDAAAGSTISQTAATDSENAPGLTNSYSLNVLGYQSGSAWFSLQQLLSTGFDILQYVQTDLAYAKDLAVESAATAAIIADTGITQSVTTATTTGFTYANLVSLNNKLPKKYQRQKVIILGAAAYAATEGMVDDNNRPVLMTDPQNQTLMKFNGTPVFRSDYFEGLTANKTVGCIISLLGFRLRDVKTQELHRYDRVPTRPGQVGLNLIGFHGWGYSPDAVAKLKTLIS